MPAIWRICMGFARAPERTIMSMGLKGWAARSSSSWCWIMAVASFQISTSFWRRSPSVMTPFRNCSSTFSACFSWSSRILRLSPGVRTSSTETVRPDLVAKRKQRFLRPSRVWATITLG